LQKKKLAIGYFCITFTKVSISKHSVHKEVEPGIWVKVKEYFEEYIKKRRD
jgi:hypothetical protein